MLVHFVLIRFMASTNDYVLNDFMKLNSLASLVKKCRVYTTDIRCIYQTHMVIKLANNNLLYFIQEGI